MPSGLYCSINDILNQKSINDHMHSRILATCIPMLSLNSSIAKQLFRAGASCLGTRVTDVAVGPADFMKVLECSQFKLLLVM